LILPARQSALPAFIEAISVKFHTNAALVKISFGLFLLDP